MIDSEIEPQPGEGKRINTINLKGPVLQKEEFCTGAALPDPGPDFECLEEKDQIRTRTTQPLEGDCALDIKTKTDETHGGNKYDHASRQAEVTLFTFAEACAQPSAKRFVFHGSDGPVNAVEVDGTFFVQNDEAEAKAARSKALELASEVTVATKAPENSAAAAPTAAAALDSEPSCSAGSSSARDTHRNSYAAAAAKPAVRPTPSAAGFKPRPVAPPKLSAGLERSPPASQPAVVDAPLEEDDFAVAQRTPLPECIAGVEGDKEGEFHARHEKFRVTVIVPKAFYNQSFEAEEVAKELAKKIKAEEDAKEMAKKSAASKRATVSATKKKMHQKPAKDTKTTEQTTAPAPAKDMHKEEAPAVRYSKSFRALVLFGVVALVTAVYKSITPPSSAVPVTTPLEPSFSSGTAEVATKTVASWSDALDAPNEDRCGLFDVGAPRYDQCGPLDAPNDNQCAPNEPVIASSEASATAVGMPDDATERFGRSAPLGAAATEHAGLQIEKDGVACPPWWLPPFMANHGQVHSGNQVAHVDADDSKPHRELMSDQSAEQPTPADTHAPPFSESSNPVRTLSFIAEGRETLNSWTLSALLCAFVFLLSVYAFDGKDRSPKRKGAKELNVKARLPEALQLQVTGTGRTIMVDASPTMTAARLARVIEKHTGVPQSSFAIYYSSRPMRGTLKESGVASGSTIELKFRGRGGGPEPQATNSLEVEIQTKPTSVEKPPAGVVRGPTAMMRGYDRDGDGNFSRDEVRAMAADFIKEKKTRRLATKAVIAMGVIILLVVGLNAGLTAAIVFLSRDTEVDGSGRIMVKGTDTPASIENPHITTRTVTSLNQSLTVAREEARSLSEAPTAEVLVDAYGGAIAVAPLTNGANTMLSANGQPVKTAPLTNEANTMLSSTGEAVKTERAKYTTQYDASKFAATLLDARPEVLDAFTSFTINYMDGATVSLGISGWARRTIDSDVLNLADAGYEGDAGSGDAGRANGKHDMMLMSSSHSHFSGVLTLREFGSAPQTALIVRGSSTEAMANVLMYSTNTTALAELLGSSELGRRRLFFGMLKNAADDAVDWIEDAADTVVATADSVVAEVKSAVDSVRNWLDDLRSDVEDAFNEAAALVTKVAKFSQNLKEDLEAIIEDFPGPAKLLELVVNLIKNAVISGDGLCFAPNCRNSHVNSGKELDLAERIPDVEILALTTMSVCFTVSDIELDDAGLMRALDSFWDSNPAVKAVKDAVESVMKPIKAAVEQVEVFINAIKSFVDSIGSIGRRLEEDGAHARSIHARQLKEQTYRLHRQLAKVQDRLLHAEDDHLRDGPTERLRLDIHRRLEGHFTELKRRRLLASELITIKTLEVGIPFNLNSRLLFEVQGTKKLIKKQLGDFDKDLDLSLPLWPTPFVAKFAVSLDINLDLEILVEGDFKGLLNLACDRLGFTFNLGKNLGWDNRIDFSEGDWGKTKVQMIGQAAVSTHVQLQVTAWISLSICLGPICGGVKASFFWEAATGFDIGVTTTSDEKMPGRRGLDADGVGCREYTFESKLTNYAEYPESDKNAIIKITDSAKETAENDYGFAIVGGFYVYVTFPWMYVAPIVEFPVGCTAIFSPLLELGGPNECTGANYDDALLTCRSPLTIEDTMGDQGYAHPFGPMLWRKSCTFGKPVRDILGLNPEWRKDLNQPTDLVREAFETWWHEKATDGINLIAESLNCNNKESKLPAAPSGNVFPSDFSTEFLTIEHEAYSRADPHNADRGSCAGAYDAGHYDTKVTWTKLKWLNKKLLQIDASDTSFATTVSGSGTFQGSGATVASAVDCADNGSERGEGVIDLRGTPYMIANVNTHNHECYKQCSGSCQSSGAGSTVCFQWIAFGWKAAMRVTCSDNNQRCVVRCGGSNGGCRPRNNMLQLALAPIALVDFVPADDETARVYTSNEDYAIFMPYPNDGTLGARGNGDGASAFPVTITAPQSGIYQVRLSQFASFSPECSSSSFFICSSDPRSSAENPGPKNPEPGTSDLSSCSTYEVEGSTSWIEFDEEDALIWRWNYFAKAQMHTFPLSEGTNILWLASREVCAIADKILISLPSLVVALADYAPADDATVGVLPGDDGASEVFFKPVPNDGTLNNMGNGKGASAFQITVMIPQSGEYQVKLKQRRGSDAFEKKAGSACRSSNLAAGADDSFFICSSDPRSTATNPDPGTPDLSSCKNYWYGTSPLTFSFSDGANSLWLASREVCALASKIKITAV